MLVAIHYRHCVGVAMTLAVMGYHLQVMTSRLSQAGEYATLVGRIGTTAGSQVTGVTV